MSAPSAPLAAPAVWCVSLRAAPGRRHFPRARTAYAAWQAAAPHLGNPAFAEVDVELAPVPAAPPSPAVVAIVAALAEGPATLSALRNRVAKRGRRLSTAEVVQAIEAGAVTFDHGTQRYGRSDHV